MSSWHATASDLFQYYRASGSGSLTYPGRSYKGFLPEQTRPCRTSGADGIGCRRPRGTFTAMLEIRLDPDLWVGFGHPCTESFAADHSVCGQTLG